MTPPPGTSGTAVRFTYQTWVLSEFHFAHSPEQANEYFENARKEYASIDAADNQLLDEDVTGQSRWDEDEWRW